MKGVDISHYQKGLTIRQIREAGKDFAIIKVTEGTWLKDAAAFDFYREAYELGFPVGCYCYSHALTGEEAQREARFLLDTIKGSPMPCGVFLDIETPEQRALSSEQLMAVAEGWCGTICKAGYVPGVYGSEGNLWSKLSLDSLPDDCLVWVAHYGRQPVIPCDLWQSSDSGSIGGVSVDTDETRSDRFRMIVEKGFVLSQTAAAGSAEKTPDISGAMALLAGYLQTEAFQKGFLAYIQKTEESE